MPEIISKYPDVTLTVLKETGFRCGGAVTPKILKNCPPSQLCQSERGEICVLGVNELTKAEQVTPQSLIGQPIILLPVIVALLLVFATGLFVGWRRQR